MLEYQNKCQNKKCQNNSHLNMFYVSLTLSVVCFFSFPATSVASSLNKVLCVKYYNLFEPALNNGVMSNVILDSNGLDAKLRTHESRSTGISETSMFQVTKIAKVGDLSGFRVDPSGRFMVSVNKQESNKQMNNDFILYDLVTKSETVISSDNRVDSGVVSSSLRWNNTGSAFSYIDHKNNVFVHKLDPSITASNTKIDLMKTGSFDLNSPNHKTSWSADDQWIFSGSWERNLTISNAKSGEKNVIPDVLTATWHPTEAILFYTTVSGDTYSYSAVTQVAKKIVYDSVKQAVRSLVSTKLDSRIISNPLTQKAIGYDKRPSTYLPTVLNDSGSTGEVVLQSKGGNLSLLAKLNPFALFAHREKERIAGRKYILPVSPNGRFLVTVQETGRDWKVVSGVENQANYEDRIRSNSTYFYEMKFLIKDLVTDEVYEFYENFIGTSKNNLIINRITLNWTSVDSFVAGSYDGMHPIKWSISDKKQEVSRVDYKNVAIGDIIHPGNTTMISTPNNETWMVHLDSDFIVIKSTNVNNSWREQRIPLNELFQSTHFRVYPVKIKILSIDGNGSIVMELERSGPLGSNTYIVKVDLR